MKNLHDNKPERNHDNSIAQNIDEHVTPQQAEKTKCNLLCLCK